MTQPIPDDLPRPPVADLSGEPLDDVDDDELLDLEQMTSDGSLGEVVTPVSERRFAAVSPLLWLPEAIRDAHPESINSWTTKVNPKGVLHTTEGSTWPDYNGWTVNPHATVMPVPGKGVMVRQHIPFSSGSFALVNLPGGVQTNRAMAFQFELVGTCQRGGPGYYWADADDTVLLDLYHQVIKPLSDAYSMPVRAPQFKPYLGDGSSRDSFGAYNGVRLTGEEWMSFTGWCGHQHVPENQHGDPGAFPWLRMLALASRNGPTPPVTTAPPFPLPTGYFFGPVDGPAQSVSGYHGHQEDLKTWQARMAARGWAIPADGLYGDTTKLVAIGFQRQVGLIPDGLIGKATWTAAWTAKVTS